MADISFKQSRGEILKGMMRNPTVSKTIKEALSSPLGSTSRQRAKKLLSIMNKLNDSHDGLGGPGMMYGQMGYAPQPEPEQVPPETPGGMVIFHKIPAPKITYGKKSKTDGAGGPGFDGKGGIFDTSWLKNIFNAPKPNTSYPSSNTSPVVGQSSTPFNFSSLSSGMRIDPNTGMITNGNASGASSLSSNPLGSGSLLNPSTFKLNIPSNFPMVSSQSTQASVPYGMVGNALRPSNNINDILSRASYTPDKFAAPVADQYTPQSFSNLNNGMSGLPSQNGVIGPWAPEKTDTNDNITPTSVKYSAIWKPAGKMDAPSFKSIYDAQAEQESGGSYTAMNKDSGALGKWQIMPEYWFNEIGLDPNSDTDKQTFLNNPQLQDALHEKIMDQLSATYNGDTDKVLAAYYGGDWAAQVVGTPDGDAPQKNGMPSVNAYVASIKAKMGVQGADPSGNTIVLDNKTTNPDGTPIKSYEDMVFDRWKIPEMREDIDELYSQKDVMTQARDQYLLQTDTAINSLLDKYTSSNDMSLPTNQAEISSQLQYLYNLRGRANQSYLSHLNDAITSKQEDIKNKVAYYNTALTGVENEIKNAATISPTQAEAYRSAINQVYNSSQSDAQKLLDIKNLSVQALNGTLGSVSDALAANEKISLITQKPKIESYWGWDGTKTRDHIPNLVDTIRIFASQSPEIQPSNIISTYLQDVLTYADSVNVRTNTTGTNTPSAISSETKKTIIEDAIKEFANLYSVSSEDSVLQNLAYSAINNDLIPKIAEQVTSQISPVSQQLMTAVQTLAPGKSWLGGNKATPTEAEFLANVKKATGDNATAIELAPMVYKEFQRSMVGQAATAKTPAIPSQTREQAVKSFLYQASSTGTVDVPVTPGQFASRMGIIYANSIYSQYFVAQ
jgi:hypothetical protein